MKYVAYHRTSTKDQHLDRGIAELTKYCADNAISLYKDKVYTDQQTGKNFNRPRYTMLKDEILESGDVLIVTELDRLGRNKEATLKELRFFKDNGIRVMVLELPTTLIDLSTMENSMARMMLETINNMMIELYASMAQAEIEKKEKRQREGIEQKKARGEWDDYGRPRVMNLEEFAIHYRLIPLLKQYHIKYIQTRFSHGTAWQGDLNNGGNLFIQADGKLMGHTTPYQYFTKHLYRYNEWVQNNPDKAKTEGLEELPIIPLHGLRHSCATLLNYLEINIIEISKTLGHSTCSTTMNIYAHSFEEQQEEVATKVNEFLRLNA